jgi:hypothetical protein
MPASRPSRRAHQEECTYSSRPGAEDRSQFDYCCRADVCDAEPACISFEIRTSDGKCYLSSSCNQDSAGYAVGDTFDLYIKQRDGWYHSPSPPPPSPSPPPPSTRKSPNVSPKSRGRDRKGDLRRFIAFYMDYGGEYRLVHVTCSCLVHAPMRTASPSVSRVASDPQGYTSRSEGEATSQKSCSWLQAAPG